MWKKLIKNLMITKSLNLIIFNTGSCFQVKKDDQDVLLRYFQCCYLNVNSKLCCLE